jgi:hypothetical protein
MLRDGVTKVGFCAAPAQARTKEPPIDKPASWHGRPLSKQASDGKITGGQETGIL